MDLANAVQAARAERARDRTLNRPDESRRRRGGRRGARCGRRRRRADLRREGGAFRLQPVHLDLEGLLVRLHVREVFALCVPRGGELHL